MQRVLYNKHRKVIPKTLEVAIKAIQRGKTLTNFLKGRTGDRDALKKLYQDAEFYLRHREKNFGKKRADDPDEAKHVMELRRKKKGKKSGEVGVQTTIVGRLDPHKRRTRIKPRPTPPRDDDPNSDVRWAQGLVEPGTKKRRTKYYKEQDRFVYVGRKSETIDRHLEKSEKTKTKSAPKKDEGGPERSIDKKNPKHTASQKTYNLDTLRDQEGHNASNKIRVDIRAIRKYKRGKRAESVVIHRRGKKGAGRNK